MKKISLSLIVLASVLSVTPSVLAGSPFRRIVKNQIKEAVQKRTEQIDDKREGFIDKVKDFVKKNLRFEARIKGKISAKNDNNLTIVGDGGITYQVNITDKTQLLKKFGGKSNLGEYSVGNEVMVFGKFTDETKKVIDARVIRDLSIQKRWGAFIGNVTVKKADSFVINTVARGNLTVYVDSATKFINRKEEIITYTDVQVNHRVMVKGVWDKTLNQVTETEKIKDFSLPVIVTMTP